MEGRGVTAQRPSMAWEEPVSGRGVQYGFVVPVEGEEEDPGEPAPNPVTPAGKAVAALWRDLITAGAVSERRLTWLDIGRDLTVGEEWLALENVLAAVWPPQMLTPPLRQQAVACALTAADGEWEDTDDDETPEAFVDRWVAIPPATSR